MNSRDYYLSRRFFDDKHFPYGFSRSGDFTISEVKVLEQQGQLLKALVDGLVTDPTDEDKHFIAALNGEVEASTITEKAWLKYLKCCNRSPVWLTTRRAANDDDDDVDIDIDDDVEELDVAVE